MSTHQVHPGRGSRRELEEDLKRLEQLQIETLVSSIEKSDAMELAEERYKRRLSIAVWFAIVLFAALMLALTYHRCFDNPAPGRPSAGAQHGAGPAAPGTAR